MFLLSAHALGLLLFARLARSRSSGGLNLLIQEASEPQWSFNVSGCPGIFDCTPVSQTSHGLTAQLNLAGPACNAFSEDIANLTIEVTYETESRLHVHIFDTASQQFTLPSAFFDRPGPPSASTPSLVNASDLHFQYEPSPFAFWITHRSEPEAPPLFDTRVSSLPPTPLAPIFNASDSSTGFDGFQLVFEKPYLQLTSALLLDANIYGLGEVVSSSGFRRQVTGNGTLQTLWARDSADPIDENMYGSHAIYMEHRFNQSTNTSQSHGVFLNSAAGADILLATPPSANTSLIQYRLIGGTLDLYFLSGPDPKSVIQQYGQVVGLPGWQPMWAFGFHLCRWGYTNLSILEEQVQNMRDANIPLEANDTDVYDPYLSGIEQDVFVKNPDGSTYIGQVWPGYTVFPDWFANSTTQFWTDALRNWSDGGVEYSGIWLDMNEISSFCEGSWYESLSLSIAGNGVDFLIPGNPDDLVTDWPEGYNVTISGPSGNITVNGTLTYGAGGNSTAPQTKLMKRGLGAGNQSNVDLNAAPYALHNAFGRLAVRTLSPNASHSGGIAELDIHNAYGYMEERATNLGLRQVHPGQRPFIISRSTFPGSGKWTGHWLGDNFSKWQYLQLNIQGILQFQLFQIPMVGADTCGFNGNTDEELCNRWMQLSAFAPFYRNHNERGAISQEPYRWPSVANASRTAIATRYALLPYWYTLFANTSTRGTPPVRALFFEFPDEPELFAIDQQFMLGSDILVTPVLNPNISSVDGIFPGRGQIIWRDWYTHEVVNATAGAPTTLAAPLGHIPVHVRDGAAILLHSQPGYTTNETRASPYALLVSLGVDGRAFGTPFRKPGSPSDMSGIVASP
ncbi:hypothetical protein EWM64_g6809 [Hericium alpestre]|uniref:Uncharacterized protein n=1 Tax=Hericium alpestre TaxID=135208 RepID=A0A4Y9ZT46_9AGAM|nr:hypothetical protein EWM64_g6809 [Hericium alpestre]